MPCAPEAKKAAQIQHLLDQSLVQTRALARGLFPVEMSLGNHLGLKGLALDVQQLFLVPCRCDGTQTISITDEGVARHVYRIAQEAATNAARHGHAKQIVIRLAEERGQVI